MTATFNTTLPPPQRPGKPDRAPKVAVSALTPSYALHREDDDITR